MDLRKLEKSYRNLNHYITDNLISIEGKVSIDISHKAFKDRHFTNDRDCFKDLFVNKKTAHYPHQLNLGYLYMKNQELEQKLSEVIAKLDNMEKQEQRIATLETENIKLRNELKQVSSKSVNENPC